MKQFDWSLFWDALGSIGTMLACIIALFQPIIEQQKKLKIQFKHDIVTFFPNNEQNNEQEEMCVVYITNNSRVSVYLSAVNLLIDGKYYQQLTLPNNDLYYQKYPYELKVGERMEINFSKKELLKKFKSKEFDNSIISIVASDTRGKSYKKKTKISVKMLKEN